MQCVPIRELKNTNSISELCHGSREPIIVTKNGREDLVIMSAEVYDRVRVLSVYEKLMQAEDDISNGRVTAARDSLKALVDRFFNELQDYADKL